jgi:hypothetical protein
MIVVCCLAAASGCSPDGPICEVSGLATHSGQPLANLVIHFSDKSGQKGGAVTDNEGRFKVLQPSGRAGIQAGSYSVWLSLPSAPKEDEAGKRNLRPRKDPDLAVILEKYGNAQKTAKTIEIKSSEELQLDF